MKLIKYLNEKHIPFLGVFLLPVAAEIAGTVAVKGGLFKSSGSLLSRVEFLSVIGTGKTLASLTFVGVFLVTSEK